jgi:hypothetical protein
MALTEATKEALYLNNIIRYIREALNLDFQDPTPVIYEDNNGAIKLSENPEFHKRSKHIDIRYHFIREAISSNLIKVVYINTKEQLADPLIKGIARLAYTL